jgi:hypothetical protein
MKDLLSRRDRSLNFEGTNLEWPFFHKTRGSEMGGHALPGTECSFGGRT